MSRLQSPELSHYLSDKWKWSGCSYECCGDNHSRGCMISREAIKKRYWKTRWRIIRNRQKSLENLQRHIYETQYLINRWLQQQEDLEVELRRTDDIAFLAGIDLGLPPDEYDPLENLWEKYDEATERLDQATKTYQSALQTPALPEGRLEHLRELEYEAKRSVRDFYHLIKSRQNVMSEYSAPLEERGCEDSLLPISRLSGYGCNIQVTRTNPTYHMSYLDRKSEYNTQIRVNVPVLPHTLRYADKNNSDYLNRCRIKDNNQDIIKVLK